MNSIYLCLSAYKAVGAAVFLAALWVAEGLWPMFVARKQHTRHYAVNLALGAINAILSATVLSVALLFATEAASRANFGLLNQFSPESVVLCAVFAIVFIDAWQYLWHMANHKVRWLWRFHAVHHSDAELDASSGVRFHVGEVVLSGVARLIVLPLLGVTLFELALYEALVLPVVLFHHSNVRIPARVDNVVRLFIVTPRMHWVHHSDLQHETDSNYSSLLSIWDRIFRTLRLRDDPGTLRLGLKDFGDSEWRPFGRLFLIPIRHNFGNARKPKN